MTGPFPKGTYIQEDLPKRRKNWGHLKPGHRYTVTREFVDHDNTLHPVGESWTFLGYSYHQMDEGLSLFISFDEKQEWYLPMQNAPDHQGAVMDYLEQYIVEIK